MKDAFYFSHDYGARNDPKLVRLQMKLGHEGKGLYWDMIEMLYEQSGYLNLSDIETYAFELRTDCERITILLNDFDLFINDGEKFWSESVLNRLKLREEKSNKARKSADLRWNNAKAMRTHSDGNAIKERKGKEIKGNIFIKPTIDEIKLYCIERENKVDPEKFLSYYESNGWIVGKVKMKDWKAAIRTWEKNSFEKKETSRLYKPKLS